MTTFSILKLPQELLIYIFLYNIPSVNDFPNNEIWNYKNVCKYWKLIISKSSELKRFMNPIREVSRNDLLRNMYVCGDVRGGGTEKEFKENLFKNGNEDWNKWYHAFTSSSWIKFLLPKTINIIAYGIKSANDCDYRDPYDWKLYGKNNFNKVSLLLHEAKSVIFEKRFQWKIFYIDNLELGQNLNYLYIDIIKPKKNINGIQISQLVFFETYVPENCNECVIINDYVIFDY